MTARLAPTWQPGDPLPIYANRPTIRSIIGHQYGAVVGPRFVESLGVGARRVGGQTVWRVDSVLRALEARAKANTRKKTRPRDEMGRFTATAGLGGDNG